jgi:hypothetical protein
MSYVIAASTPAGKPARGGAQICFGAVDRLAFGMFDLVSRVGPVRKFQLPAGPSLLATAESCRKCRLLARPDAT